MRPLIVTSCAPYLILEAPLNCYQLRPLLVIGDALKLLLEAPLNCYHRRPLLDTIGAP
jgi:hypothetical protein